MREWQGSLKADARNTTDYGASMNEEDRLERIETKVSFTEDLLDELNRTVFRQQEQIERLQAQVMHLSERLRDLPTTGPARDPRDEIPPHY
jgi:SlyX protein